MSQDFCTKCQKDLSKVIKNWINEKLEPEVEELIPRKNGIDWDKACALRLAGWSSKAIAEELECAEGTISSSIVPKLDAYLKKRKGGGSNGVS